MADRARSRSPKRGPAGNDPSAMGMQPHMMPMMMGMGQMPQDPNMGGNMMMGMPGQGMQMQMPGPADPNQMAAMGMNQMMMDPNMMNAMAMQNMMDPNQMAMMGFNPMMMMGMGMQPGYPQMGPGMNMAGNGKGVFGKDPNSLRAKKYKTRLCQFWAKNRNCHQGENCNFAHSEDELPATWKTSLCQNFEMKGSCMRGDNCGYAHGKGDLREYRAERHRESMMAQNEGGKGGPGTSGETMGSPNSSTTVGGNLVECMPVQQNQVEEEYQKGPESEVVDNIQISVVNNQGEDTIAENGGYQDQETTFHQDQYHQQVNYPDGDSLCVSGENHEGNSYEPKSSDEGVEA